MLQEKFSRKRLWRNFLFNVFIKNDNGKFKKLLKRDIDIIFCNEDAYGRLSNGYRYLTPNEIRRNCVKKYKRKDPEASIWTSFLSMFPSNESNEIMDIMKKTILVPIPLNGIPVRTFSEKNIWNDVFYFDSSTFALYNLSRIKSYTIRESRGYTEFLFSNEENLDEKINNEKFKGYFSISGKKNIKNIANYLKEINHPLGDEIACLTECINITEEFDVFFQNIKGYGGYTTAMNFDFHSVSISQQGV